MMSVFLVSLAGMIALALVFVLPPLLRSTPLSVAEPPQDAARSANLQVLREQLAALDAEHASGALDDAQHRAARIEIERRALEEENDAAPATVATRAGKMAVAVGAFVPVFAFVLYGLLGTPEVMLPQAQSQSQAAGTQDTGGVTSEQIEAMVSKLANRLETQTAPQPGDAEAWTMLGRSYAVLQRFPEAGRAFARARQLAPDNAQLMADHADVMAMLQGQKVDGEPAKLAQRALQTDPGNLKAMALLGSAAFERKDFSGALTYWSRARRIAEPGSAFAAGLDSSIQQARAAGGQESSVAPAAVAEARPAVPDALPAVAQSAKAAVPVQPASPSTGAKVSGVVQLAGSLAGKVAPGDTLFVFARAAQGPRMPLAILKLRASELPVTFSLDDSNAMSPDMNLSKFASVVVGARISRSGEATPRSGDLLGQVGPVETGSAKLTIMIDSVQP